ncbi:hypothetical protein LR48_Vigan02g078000 [Vigna angularis]|uniref:Ubiquitin-like protease family profile domain-containing protein n=1 Tax=Phaseolus angularis TaxID=3914 RepID=A0A0L9TVP8_PHAAN|nr:hypothetical protein LR48_Vigan02g078000 [Vigna angularis]
MKIPVSNIHSLQFRASRESEEWNGKRLAAQERQRLNDAPYLLSRGGYAKLEKKLRKSRADALGLESLDLAPAPARYELWKAARTKSDGNMTSSSAALISQRIFTRPQKQSIHDTVIHEDDDMAEAENDPLSKLMTRLPRLKKAPLELYWDLRVFGIPPHVPVYITLSDALEMIGGDQMLNIFIIQLWCMYMDTIVVDQGRSSIMHWQLMVIIPKACKIIWFCSLHRKMKNDLRTMLQGVIGKSRGQLVQILYPKCNQQLDSWECGFYVMCWIKTIIRAVITDDWNETSGGGKDGRLYRCPTGAHGTSIWMSEGCTPDVCIGVGPDTLDVYTHVRCGPPDV